MPTINITGWERGLRKVSMTKLIQECSGQSLADSKHAVDDLLEGKSITIHINDQRVADEFVARAKELGAIISN